MGIIFAMLQTMLPLASESVELKNRIFIAVVFVAVWILYSVFSDTIDERICSLLGRDWVVQDRQKKLQRFECVIVPASYSINDSLTKGIPHSDYDVQFLYNEWCKTIHFFATYCVVKKEKWEIDFSIIRKSNYNSVWVTRVKFIDVEYVKAILKIMNQFDTQYETFINSQVDYKEYKKQLNKLVETFLI